MSFSVSPCSSFSALASTCCPPGNLSNSAATCFHWSDWKSVVAETKTAELAGAVEAPDGTEPPDDPLLLPPPPPPPQPAASRAMAATGTSSSLRIRLDATHLSDGAPVVRRSDHSGPVLRVRRTRTP